MSGRERQLPPGDREDGPSPMRRQETGLEYFRRCLVEDHGIDPVAEAAAAPSRPWRSWPSKPAKDRIDAILRGEDPDAREEPGADG